MTRGCCGIGSDPHAPEGSNCMDCDKKLWMFNRRHEALGVDGPLCTKCINKRSTNPSCALPPVQRGVSDSSCVTNSLADRSTPTTPATPAVHNPPPLTLTKHESSPRAASSYLPHLPTTRIEEEEDDDLDMWNILYQFGDRIFVILGGPWGRVRICSTFLLYLLSRDVFDF